MLYQKLEPAQDQEKSRNRRSNRSRSRSSSRSRSRRSNKSRIGKWAPGGCEGAVGGWRVREEHWESHTRYCGGSHSKKINTTIQVNQ